MVKSIKAEILPKTLHNKIVILLFVLFILVFFCEILYLKLGVIPKQINVGWLAVGLIPPLSISILFFFLWYDNWFKKKKRSLRDKLKKTVFWIVVLFLCIIWGAIYYFFIFS
jgi:hypothetical protein